jgi:hypothetical protein
MGETESLAESHIQLSRAVHEQVERPLRGAFINEPVWNQLKNLETTLMKNVRDYEDKEFKVTKAKKAYQKSTSKKSDANAVKLVEANDALQAAKHEWLTKSPVLFDA